MPTKVGQSRQCTVAHKQFTFSLFLTHFAVFTDSPVAGIKLVLVSGSANYF